MSTSRPVLEMRRITKRFRNIAALTEVSIDLFPAEVHCIVGENGAGKSTLMKILSGSYPCSSYQGEILLEGRRAEFLSPRQARDCGIGMIYQEPELQLDLTIGENIFLGSLPTRRRGFVDWQAVFETAARILKRLDLHESPRKKVRDLSSSQQQLVAVAKALSRSLSILVLDEPTAALTQHESFRLLSILRKLKMQGISIIYVSHRIQEVFEVADRITVLRDGRVVSTRPVASTTPDQIISEMVGRDLDQAFPRVQAPRVTEVLRVERFSIPHPYSPGKMLLEDISFSLRTGEILGLAGLIGSGRSELARAIFGAAPHDGQGKLWLNGQSIEVRSPREAVRLGIGLLPEDRKRSGFIPTLNIMQNVTLANLGRISRLKIIDFDQERHVVTNLFRRLRIKVNRLSDSVADLSGGNQQKVVLAKWLLAELKVLILDEPTRGIDVGAKIEIYSLIAELARRGLGIIVISSELPELVGLCHRILVLAKGKVQRELGHDEASEERILQLAAGAA